MSLDMMHAFERDYSARFSDMQWRGECEAFSRGWVAAREAATGTTVEAAFLAVYRAAITDSAWALQAEAFGRGWRAWLRFAEGGSSLFSAGRAGVVRVRLHSGRLAPTRREDVPASGNTIQVDHDTPTLIAQKKAVQRLTHLLRGIHPSATQEP